MKDREDGAEKERIERRRLAAKAAVASEVLYLDGVERIGKGRVRERQAKANRERDE